MATPSRTVVTLGPGAVKVASDSSPSRLFVVRDPPPQSHSGDGRVGDELVRRPRVLCEGSDKDKDGLPDSIPRPSVSLVPCEAPSLQHRVSLESGRHLCSLDGPLPRGRGVDGPTIPDRTTGSRSSRTRFPDGTRPFSSTLESLPSPLVWSCPLRRVPRLLDDVKKINSLLLQTPPPVEIVRHLPVPTLFCPTPSFLFCPRVVSRDPDPGGPSGTVGRGRRVTRLTRVVFSTFDCSFLPSQCEGIREGVPERDRHVDRVSRSRTDAGVT